MAHKYDLWTLCIAYSVVSKKVDWIVFSNNFLNLKKPHINSVYTVFQGITTLLICLFIQI